MPTNPHFYAKERTALNKRLTAEGRFDAYLEAREGYKKLGMTDKNAWQVAALMFAPLDPDASLEFEPSQEVLEIFEQLGPINTLNPPAIEVVNKNFRRTQRIGGTEETEDALRPPQKRRATFEALAALVPHDRKAQPLEIAQWVFENNMTPVEQIDPDTVPSRGALGLLRHTRMANAYGEFVRNIYSKLIPDRKQLDAAARFTDDGREILNDLDAFDREFCSEERQDATASL